jgi:hypothetical protein
LSTFFKTIIALVFLPPLIASIFVYHAEMMTYVVKFPSDEIPLLEFRDTD